MTKKENRKLKRLRRTKIIPTRRALYLTIIPLVCSGLALVFQPFLWVAVVLDLILILLIAIDRSVSAMTNKLQIDLDVPKWLEVGKFEKCRLNCKNTHNHKIKFSIQFEVDSRLDRKYCNKIFICESDDTISEEFSIQFSRRGTYTIERMFIKSFSLFGLLVFHNNREIDLSIDVSPMAFLTRKGFHIIARERSLMDGVQRASKPFADGSQFDMLRDYQKGDRFNRIDWCATARRRKPVSRTYLPENQLSISIAVDCGRLMATESKFMSQLDHAVNGSLLLSYAALKERDKISITAFDRDIKAHIPFADDIRKLTAFNKILTPLEYNFVESDYKKLFTFLLAKNRKRTLTIMFSDIIDDSHAEIFVKYLSLLKKKHMFLLILLKDYELFQAADPLHKKESLWTRTAAADLILRRENTIRKLKKLGVEIIDLYPHEISAPLINRYYSYKRDI